MGRWNLALLGLATLSLTFFGGCFSPTHQEGLACSDKGECPGEQECVDNVCGGVRDAGDDAKDADAGLAPDADADTYEAGYWDFNEDNASAALPGNGAKLESVAHYASGPCGGRASGHCQFESRTFFTDVSVGRIELITAYGRYWEFEVGNGNAPLPGSGSLLESVAHYASGPCLGQVAGTCKFDSSAVLIFQGVRYEGITAYGRYWNFNKDDGHAPLGDNASLLESVPRYADGPCMGQASGQCEFDSRTFFVDSSGDTIESVTAYGRLWNFNGIVPVVGNGELLESLSHYAAGPCVAQAAGQCRFDSRTSYVDTNGDRIDSITYEP